MTQYCILHFVAGNETAIVSQSWIRNEVDKDNGSTSMSCWWPPYKNDRDIAIAADQHMTPIERGNGRWKLYHARMVGKPFQTYSEARQKWSDSLVTSDVNSETDGASKRKTRKIVARRTKIQATSNRSNDASSEDEPSDSHTEDARQTDVFTLLDLPLPPNSNINDSTSHHMASTKTARQSPRKLLKPAKITNSTSCTVTSESSLPYENHFHSTPSRPMFQPQVLQSSNFAEYTARQGSNSYFQTSPELPTYTDISFSCRSTPKSFNNFDINNILPQNQHEMPSNLTPNQTFNSPDLTSPNIRLTHETPKAAAELQSTTRNSDFEKQTTRTLAQLKMHQQLQGETLDCILQLVQKLSEGQGGMNHQPTESEADDPLHNLPLTTQDELDQMESQLADAAIKNKLAKKLSQIGGTTVSDITRRIFKHLLSNSLAKEYSWLGFKKKKRFDKLILKDVVFAAVRLNPLTQTCTDKAIEDEVKNWLRHAKFRCTKDNNK